jgi:hypothetical protein
LQEESVDWSIMSGGKDIVLLIHGELHEFESKDLNLKSFPHPKGYTMLVVDVNDKLYELQCTQPRKYSSWFIDQRVSSSQNLYLANVLDPRFLLLPFLERSTGKYSPLDQIVLLDEKYSRFPFNRVSSWKMQDMCDVNDKLGDDMILYRYNESKMLEWLKRKVDAVAGVIRTQRLAKACAQNTKFVAGFNVSKQSTGVTSESAPASTTSGEQILVLRLGHIAVNTINLSHIPAFQHLSPLSQYSFRRPQPRRYPRSS